MKRGSGSYKIVYEVLIVVLHANIICAVVLINMLKDRKRGNWPHQILVLYDLLKLGCYTYVF